MVNRYHPASTALSFIILVSRRPHGPDRRRYTDQLTSDNMSPINTSASSVSPPTPLLPISIPPTSPSSNPTTPLLLPSSYASLLLIVFLPFLHIPFRRFLFLLFVIFYFLFLLLAILFPVFLFSCSYTLQSIVNAFK